MVTSKETLRRGLIRYISYTVIYLSATIVSCLYFYNSYTSESKNSSYLGFKRHLSVTVNCQSSKLCAKREQCHPCSWVDSKRNHSRYIIIGPMRIPHEGIGGTLNYLAVFIEMAVKYDLHLVFRGNITIDRLGETFNIHETLGFTASSVAFSSNDPILAGMPVRLLPENPKECDIILKEEMHLNKVVYDSGNNETEFQLKKPDMALAIEGVVADHENACKSTRNVLQQLYWNAEEPHICSVFSPSRRNTNQFNIAIHIRRGDTIEQAMDFRIGKHCFYVSAAKIAVHALANISKMATDVPCHIAIGVFSDSPGNSVIDENGQSVDMERDLLQRCSEAGVQCKVSLVLAGHPLNALECFSLADVFIGSKSSFSYVGGMLNLNVKIFHEFWHPTDMQDALSLGSDVCNDTEVATDAQNRLDQVVREWYDCRLIGQGTQT